MTDQPTILVIEHEPQCPAAHFGTWLTDAGAELEVCRPWAGDSLPAVTSYDAVVVLGGAMGANDDDRVPWLGQVKQLVRDATDAGTATLGICLGHQVIAVALGGEVEVNAAGQQVGLFELGWTAEAANDELLGEVVAAGAARGVQWNSDVVTRLPEAATLLAAMPTGEVQAARFAPRVWGVQHHPEVDREVLTSWAAGDRDDHLEKGIDQEAVLSEVDAARDELDRTWRPLAERLVQLARG